MERRIGDAHLETVRRAIKRLAGSCDYAARKDSSGFNKYDAEYGHLLASLEEWTPKQAYDARLMIEKYRSTQLAGLDLPPVEIFAKQVQEANERAKREQQEDAGKGNAKKAWLKDVRGELYVIAKSDRYDPVFVEAVKQLPGRKFDVESKSWYVPVSAAHDKIIPFIDRFQCVMLPDQRERLESAVRHISGRIELSSAASIDDETLKLVIPSGLDLYPFQKAGVAYALGAGNVLIADQMGLGKTPTSLVTVATSGAFPCVVICPASLKRNWEREAKRWVPGKRVAVLNGTVFPLCGMDGTPAVDIAIINFNSRILEKWIDWLHVLQPKAIIIDEAHNVKNPSAKQTKLVLELCRKRVPDARKILLTGTPVVNRPMEFWTLIRILGYEHVFGGFNSYRYRYDTKYQPRLAELNERARSVFMVRRTKDEVLKELPAKMRTVVPVDITNRDAYEEAEADVARWFAERKSDDDLIREEVEAFVRAHGIDPVHIPALAAEYKKQVFATAYNVAARAEQLVRWEALKRVAVEGKMDGVREWLNDFLEGSDESIVVFAVHVDVVERIADWFGCEFIHGGVPVERRMDIVDRFQAGKHRVIVGNMQAMGEGLTLTRASNVVFVEFGWNPKSHDQAEDRCHRIGQRDAVNVWNLAATDTVDEELIKLIESKRAVVDAMTDGRISDVEEDIMESLKAYVTRRHGGG
jgi:SWI/SNF-related matrix-associated actin-dependent regulator 1 of chromatin subfamily A